jgi:hypothetical protein
VLVLETRVDRLLCRARFAFHLATPVEGAGASFSHYHFLCSIAATATHEIASVDAYRCVVALSSVRAQNAESEILVAESWRLLEKDKILICRWLVIGIEGLQRESVSNIIDGKIIN